MRLTMLLTCALAFGVIADAAFAQQRYGDRPPVTVSPDLSAPWLLQLQRSPVGAPVRGQAVNSRIPQARMTIAPPPAQRRQVRAAPEQARPAAQAGTAVQSAGLAAAPARRAPPAIDPQYLPQVVDYPTPHKPGTIVVDTTRNFLYLVMADGKARRYGVGTGRPGFEWAGRHRVTMKREWPDWRPPQTMIARERKKGRILPAHMPGGPDNPLGARALYLGSTLYRIHGTNEPWTIGRAVSSGCIRMRNEDVIDLYERVKVGTNVIVI